MNHHIYREFSKLNQRSQHKRLSAPFPVSKQEDHSLSEFQPAASALIPESPLDALRLEKDKILCHWMEGAREDD